MDIVTLTHRNPAATMPLQIPTEVTTNVPEETFLANMRANAKRPGVWIKREAAHSGEVWVCGGGPSLAECLPDIIAAQQRGAAIWGLNRVAGYLSIYGVRCDVQFIMDARPDADQMVGPAGRHIFASQCDPNVFAAAPAAELVHVTVGPEAPEFPDYPLSYTFIGCGGTVGVTALGLAACLGYRNITCVGYDSSISGEARHAYAQAMTAEEQLVCETEFNGVLYRSAAAMKAQVSAFFKFARAIERDLGGKIQVLGSGLLPAMWNHRFTGEREKYETIWRMPEYRLHSPGAEEVGRFCELGWLDGDDTVLDAGCGGGEATRALEARGIRVLTADIAENCMLDRRPDFCGELRDLPAEWCDWVFCCDVLEHIPPADVDATLTALLRCAKDGCYLRISTVDDEFGSTIGAPLHLSVHDAGWWHDALRRLGFHVAGSIVGDDHVVFLTRKE